MPNIRLTLACGDYDINRGLVEGRTKPRGIDLTVLPMSSPERHWRMHRHLEFDVCEISLASTLVSAGHGTHPFAAIPVFPHRRFRHGYVFVNAAAGIDHPKALEGRRVGLRTWQTTAVHWIRGMLRDFYGVDVRSIRYWTQDEEDIPVIWPIEGWEVQRVPAGRNVDEMLCAGDLDAVFYPETLPSIARGDRRVRRLWEDPKAEEIRFFERTGLFPLMHTVVFREDVLRKDPWAAVEILHAFRQSKAMAFQRMQDPRHVSLAWVQALVEEQRRLLGADAWPYDLAGDNRRQLELMIRWGADFGLMPSIVEPEALFFAPSLEALPAYVTAP